MICDIESSLSFNCFQQIVKTGNKSESKAQDLLRVIRKNAILFKNLKTYPMRTRSLNDLRCGLPSF